MKGLGISPVRLSRYFVAFGLASVVALACGKSDQEPAGGDAGNPAAGASGRAGSTGTGGARAGGSTGGSSARAGSPATAGQGASGGSSGSSNPNQGGTSQQVGGKAGAAGNGGRPAGGGSALGGAGSTGLGGAGAGGAEGGAAGDGSGGEGNACTAPATPPAAGCGIYGTVGLEYQAGEATASVLSFSVRLTAAEFSGGVPLNQIEVQYYLSLEEDSGFQASVDSFVQHAPDADYTSTSEISLVKLEPAQRSTSVAGSVCQTHFIRIRNTSPAELAPYESDGPYVELHVTLTPNDSAAPNQTHDDDQGYEPDPPTFHGNLGMGVFVCGMLVSGCTPGDAGPC